MTLNMALIILLMNFLFMMLNHPLSLGLMLLIQTIMISLITGLMTYNYWFSYIIFLIMIGGMLILFIYMTSIASNEKFKFNSKIFYFMIMMLSMNMILFLLDYYIFNFSLNMWDMMTQNKMFNFNLNLNKFLTWPLIFNFFMLMIYLLITLIMAVKITNIKYGPLRQKI
uniref:NADH-ubiquinone oxidoreductase chain 6 n=1 Tax=Lamiinae sp. 2 ACP-2013 TaxID=1434532 RepID=A0A3G5FNF6_9CUCU|nr:NADH dehydrogenase subunit 6 [Lamiinae sp. 2 ACP-2013]